MFGWFKSFAFGLRVQDFELISFCLLGGGMGMDFVLFGCFVRVGWAQGKFLGFFMWFKADAYCWGLRVSRACLF